MIKTLRKGITSLAIVAGLVTSTAFANTSFELKTQSLNGDYIGQGQSWDFSSSNGSFLTVKEATSQEVSFKAESFDISYMSFEFSAGEGQTLQNDTLYYPAKRNPFRGSYNGINVSGDGRGCNKILGGFYVHEYQVDDESLQKAAIDFVQYCEQDENQPLYGSLRYNSSIANSCDDGDCTKVAGYLDLQTNTTTNTDTQNTTNPYTTTYENSLSTEEKIERDITEATFDIFQTMHKNYPFFYQECVAVQERAGLLMDPDYNNYINPSACNKKHIASLTIANKLLTKIFGPRSDDENGEVSTEQINKGLEFLDFLSERVLLVKNRIQNQGDLTQTLKIVLGAIAYTTDFSKKILEIQLKYQS